MWPGDRDRCDSPRVSNLHRRLRLLPALEGGLDEPGGTATTEGGELVRVTTCVEEVSYLCL